MSQDPKIVFVRLHVFPLTTRREACDFACRMAEGMSMATVEFEHNDRVVQVTHHDSGESAHRKFWPEDFDINHPANQR